MTEPHAFGYGEPLGTGTTVSGGACGYREYREFLRLATSLATLDFLDAIFSGRSAEI